MSAHGHVDLGHTVAGWTGTALAILGSAAAAVGICLSWAPGLWIGLALVLAAGLATWLLHLAGWGKPSGPRPASAWDWRVRDAAAGAGHEDCLGCRAAGRAAAASGTRAAELSPAPDGTA
ncbi:HGxxPAAW family protein [Streptomyces sp. NPDC046866]|uniref:HGxxPAAW family protein n=1 Tax=Streptomyces sp. NPDC046866 TaxID=3154921 RepID=UPI0034530DA2